MDRPLKERLVGATVLVALMIVVVPLFLDGPAHTDADSGNTVSESLSLPPAERPQHVITLDGDSPASTAPRAVESAAGDPPPAAVTKPVERVAPQTAPGPAPKSAESAPVKTEPTAPAKQSPAPSQAPASDSGWAVQVGSFRNEDNARGLAGDLLERDYSAFHVRKNIDGRVVYRVLIGPEQDRERADALASRLRGDGLPTTIVRHP